MPQALHSRSPPQDPHAAPHGREALLLQPLRPPVRPGRESPPAPPRSHRRASLHLRSLLRQVQRLQPAQGPRADPQRRKAVRVREVQREVPPASPFDAPQVRLRAEVEHLRRGIQSADELQAGDGSAAQFELHRRPADEQFHEEVQREPNAADAADKLHSDGTARADRARGFKHALAKVAGVD